MPYQISRKTFNFWKERLKNILDGEAKSGVALSESLKTAAEKAYTDFIALVNRYTSLRAQESQVRSQAAALQKDGIKMLKKARHGFVADTAPADLQMILKLYNLHQPLPTKRLDVLALLEKTIQVEAEQEDAARKPRTAVMDEIKTLAPALREQIDKFLAVRADIEETRNSLQEAFIHNAELRERVYSHLICVLRDGSSDPRLIDYGLREKFYHGQSPKVTVVDVEAVESEEAVVEGTGS